MYKLDISPKAVQDITNISSYISVQLHNPTAANKLIEQIHHSINLITEMPYMYPLCTLPKPTKYNYRKAVVKNYIIVYSVREQPEKRVVISRIVYAKTNYPNFIN